MNKMIALRAAGLVAALSVAAIAAKTPAELEKEKALAQPYANDLGPATVDVSGYPANIQAGYKLLQVKCAKCHTPSRPLNSQFVETDGKDPAERKKNLDALMKSDPSLFKEKHVWQIEDGIWQRYVKRMMSKPGCDISKDEGKKIWEFVAYDSRVRKLGANKEKWAAHRRKLLSEFKAKHAHRYEELYK